MKFRTISKRYESIQTIKRSILAASKLSSTLIFRIDENSIQLIPDTIRPLNPVTIHCHLNRRLLFDEYSFKGLSNVDNLIYFFVDSLSLIDVINSIPTRVQMLKMKLSLATQASVNNDDDSRERQCRPILKFTTENPTCLNDQQKQTIDNHIFISIIDKQSWSLYDEYSFSNNENDQTRISSMNLPSFNLLAHDIEKLNNCSNFIKISTKYYQDTDNFNQNQIKAKLTLKTIILSLEQSSSFEKLPLYNHDNDDNLYLKSKIAELNNAIDKNERIQALLNQYNNRIFIDIRKLNQLISLISILEPTDGIIKLHNQTAILFQFFSQLVNFKIILPHCNID